MKINCKIFLILSIVCYSNTFSSTAFYIDFNAGGSNIGITRGINFGWFHVNKQFLSGRWFLSDQIVIAAVEPTTAESVNDVGILYGYEFDERLLGSVGLAYTWGKKAVSKSDEIDFSTVGVPMNIYFCMLTLKHWKLGINIYGNINSKISYGGASLSCLFYI